MKFKVVPPKFVWSLENSFQALAKYVHLGLCKVCIMLIFAQIVWQPNLQSLLKLIVYSTISNIFEIFVSN